MLRWSRGGEGGAPVFIGHKLSSKHKAMNNILRVPLYLYDQIKNLSLYIYTLPTPLLCPPGVESCKLSSPLSIKKQFCIYIYIYIYILVPFFFSLRFRARILLAIGADQNAHARMFSFSDKHPVSNKMNIDFHKLSFLSILKQKRHPFYQKNCPRPIFRFSEIEKIPRQLILASTFGRTTMTTRR